VDKPCIALLDGNNHRDKIKPLLGALELILVKKDDIHQLYEESVDSILFQKLSDKDLIINTRKNFPYTPIFLLSNYISEIELIDAYNMGFDGMLKTSYSTERVYAIVENTIKTYQRLLLANIDKPINVQFNTDRNEIIINGTSYSLTPIEMKIILFLKNSPNKLVSKNEIFNHLWDGNCKKNFSLNTHIYNIKKKIPPFRPLIHTKKGLGYIFSLN